uniref:Secreted protein n=1 Tax=Gongylonema pulchrum TaxID=637853 RepID=A0A183CWU8_9BILA
LIKSLIFSHWTRILLIILAVVAVTLCCLVPCICALGIWFAGWFGLRSRADNKPSSSSSPISNNSYAPQQPIMPQQQPQMATILPQNSIPSGSTSPRERVDTYVYEEKRSDHFYHRQPSPRPHDTEYRRYYTSSRL